MPKFPILVRRGSATVRVHDYDNNGSSHFMITWNLGGERKRESRSTSLEDALEGHAADDRCDREAFVRVVERPPT